MYTFFPERKLKDGFVIRGGELKHLRVRRIRIGEEIGVIHEGRIFRCILEEVSRESAFCRIIGELDIWRPRVKVSLIQSVTADLKTMDLIVQKATEIGISELTLLISERSFQKAEVIEKRKDRWSRIIREAMKQSNRPEPLDLRGPVYIDSISGDEELKLVFHRDTGSKDVSEVNVKGFRSFAVAVGPEGGFTDQEVEILKNKGFLPVRINTYILRSETAAIVAAGLIVSLGGP